MCYYPCYSDWSSDNLAIVFGVLTRGSTNLGGWKYCLKYDIHVHSRHFWIEMLATCPADHVPIRNYCPNCHLK